MVRMREMWGRTQDQICPDKWFFTAGAENVVSAARIARMPWRFYKNVLHLLVAPPSHRIHQDYKVLGPGKWLDTFSKAENEQLNNESLFLHVVERAWNLIFNCYAEEALGSCECQDSSLSACVAAARASAKMLHRKRPMPTSDQGVEFGAIN